MQRWISVSKHENCVESSEKNWMKLSDLWNITSKHERSKPLMPVKSRAVTALSKKLQMIRHSQESFSLKALRPSTSPFAPATETAEDLVHLETQKKILLNKLTQLSHNFTTEERRRRELEAEVVRERCRASGVFQRSLEVEKPSERLQTMQMKLDNVRDELQGQLDVLVDLRQKLNLVRRDPFALRPPRSPCESLPNTSVGRAVDESRELFTRLTEAEKAALVAYQRESEKFLRVSASRQLQGALGDSLHEVGETDKCQAMIDAILDELGVESLIDLLAEAEQLERENRELYAFIVKHDERRRTFIQDIGRLDKEHDNLVKTQAETEDAKKSRVDELNKHIGMMQDQLGQIQSQKRKDEIEFSVVYSALESLFNALQLSWDDSPDGSMTVTTGNAMFAIGAIEQALGDLMVTIEQADT
jgi:hypothetical protein